jgi:integrase/recombinase XerC
MRINEALDAYLLQLGADGRSEHTIGQASRHVRLFEAWIGREREVESVGHEELARFLASDVVRLRADGEPRKASSANALRSSLRTFWSYLHAAGIVSTNPGRLIRRAVCGTPLPKALRDEDREKLLAALAGAETDAERRDRVLFELMLGTGIRVGSALGARVEDIDLDAAELRVVRAKLGREQVVYLSERLLELLSPWIGDRSKGYLFRGPGGGALSGRHVARRLAGWCERAGVQGISPHALRHTFATGLYRRTGDIALTKDALGHAALASTLVYARVDQVRVRSAVAG